MAMTVQTFSKRTATRGEAQIIDLTGEVLACIEEAGVRDGTATVFVPGSTAGFDTSSQPICCGCCEAGWQSFPMTAGRSVVA